MTYCCRPARQSLSCRRGGTKCPPSRTWVPVEELVTQREVTPRPVGRPVLDGSTLTRPSSSWVPVEAEHVAQREVTPRTEGGDSAIEMEMRAVRTSMVRMAQRIDLIEGKIEEVLSLLRGSQSLPSAPVEDLLLSPCSTVTELQDLDQSLGNQERRNKMLLFLASLGGLTPGAAIRRMLRRVATNNVLKEYSLRGRKAKKSFQDLTLCRVLTAAAQKNFPALNAAEAEDLIGLALKFAPHRRQAED
ncbi:uncharacterized protein LOC143125502 isoform X3 [Alosa pseudoharengus]|uniref:uncharacterized protein LOC143124043 isoform X3 n=1 Tax=Alosa pseudoharengus TaxID=34774 RepID=UPI003F891D9F